MLYEPTRHEALSPASWDATVARNAIERIVARSVQQYSPRSLWPSHPLDSSDPTSVFHSIYMGAAGVMWAVDHLARIGLANNVPHFSPIFDKIFAANHDEAKNARSGTDGLLIADSGVLLLGARLYGPEHMARRLSGAIDANQSNRVLELMWGSPGTMLAALFMHEWTGDAFWADKFRRDAAWLLDQL